MLRILNPDRSLFWGPFWWPQLMSWGNHARSLQCRCEESVVQRCVGWDSQEGALHHANSLIGVGGSGKTSIESLQYRNACVPDVCVLLGNSQHVPVNTGDPIPNWTKTGTVEFDLINFYLMISIFCMFHLQEMWDDPNWDRFNIQYSFGLQATRRWAILTKMETEALPLTSFVAWPSAGTQFGSSFCNYFPWDLRNWVPLNSLVKHHSLWNGPNWPTGIINHVQAIQKLLYFVWSPQWHLYILLLANLLAFYLTYLLAFYLAYLLAYYLLKSSGTLSGKHSGTLSGISSGILSDILFGILSGIPFGILSGISSNILSGISPGTLSGISSGILSDILFGILSGIPSGILSDISSNILSGISSGIRSGISHGILSGISSGILSDILSGISSGIRSGISHGILSGISSGILSDILSGISSGILSGRWGPAVHTELGRSQVEVQQCTLSWEGPRLRSSGAHWAGKVPGWGPAVHTELGRWRRAWRRVGKGGSGGRGGGGDAGGGGAGEAGGAGGEQLW